MITKHSPNVEATGHLSSRSTELNLAEIIVDQS